MSPAEKVIDFLSNTARPLDPGAYGEFLEHILDHVQALLEAHESEQEVE